MIMDDQGGTRNPYKCMNVMKQDAMNDKTIERCKACEKQISQQENVMLKMESKSNNIYHTHSYMPSIIHKLLDRFFPLLT